MNPNTPDFHEIVLEHAEETLFPAKAAACEDKAIRQAYFDFMKTEKARIKRAHRDGATGLEAAAWRSAMVDLVICDFLENLSQKLGKLPFTLFASGGYGRALLNPGSDIDLQFLLPGKSTGKKLKNCKEWISQVQMLLFDAGFIVGHGARTLKEAIRFANQDHITKTAFLDARFINGDAAFFDQFETTFFNECIRGKEKAYFEERSNLIRARHEKYGRTSHRQEPHVKMGCGGLQDYHNLIWLIWILQKSRNLRDLVESQHLTHQAYLEIEEAYAFIMRVRTELHYIQKNESGDILTIRLQGIIAQNFGYPGHGIIQQSEHFMRDYYRHTRALYQHGTSLMQAFHLEVENSTLSPTPILGALAARFHRPERPEEFDGFVSRGGLIFPKEGSDPFADNPQLMMKFFRHIQERGLRTSPEIRHLFEKHSPDIDDNFRRNRTNREVFEQILQNRGQVAQVLRKMHRVGFLGLYLPEFGQLTDLVQHEFFHQYTADEHTLRCIDELDRLLQSTDPKEEFFKKIFQDLDDPVALYIALIMHDTGRAENVRVHEDASATLASQVCKRLMIQGDRLRLILFLVDHHLTFWRTATTKDISNPETIANIASVVKNRERMEALYLFTYVDSKGTNSEAWNDWKASLMSHLYLATCFYLEDRKEFDERYLRPVQRVSKRVVDRLPESFGEEIEAHFKSLPKRYFSFRGATSIIRHIRLFHEFFLRLDKPALECLEPVFGWEGRPDQGYTLMEVVSWNRHGLLATIAGALASRTLNILSADIFIREDDLVLDIFRVCTTNFSPISSEAEIKKLEDLIKEACRPGGKKIDFRELIVKANEPSVLDGPKPLFNVPQRVVVTNDLSEKVTIIEIQATDRIGLLFDIFSALAVLNIDVLSARISTQAGAAIDRFEVVDKDSEKKIDDPGRLEEIKNRVWSCVEVTDIEVRTARKLGNG